MVGGSEAAFDRVRPLFDLMGKNITRVGGNGDGQTAKVANQIIVALNIEAVGEALLFAAQGRRRPGRVREALMGGFASSRILEVHGERMVRRTFDPGFRIELHQKDLNLALGTARALGVSLPNTATAQELSTRAWPMAARRGTTRRWCGRSRSWRISRSASMPAEPAEPAMRPDELLRRMFDAAIASAQPALCVPPHLPQRPRGRCLVIGAGKASAAMARAVEDHWGEAPSRASSSRATATASRAGASRSWRRHTRCPMPPGWAQRSACWTCCAACARTTSCCA